MDFCSNSYSSDIDMDSFEQATSDIMIQELQSKNETLQGTNNQLMKTIESLKTQLKEVNSADLIGSMNNKIQELQQLLNQETLSKSKIEKQVQILINQRKAQEEDFRLQKNKFYKEISELRDLLESQKLKYEEVKTERDNILLELQGKDDVIEEMSYQIQVLRQKRKKVIEINKEFSKEIQKLQLQLNAVSIKQQQVTNENNALTQEAESLKLELSTIKTLSEGHDRTIVTLNEQVKTKIHTIQILQNNHADQCSEIEQLIKQRDMLVHNLQSLHQSYTKLESLCSSFEKEKDLLQKRLLQATNNKSKNENDDSVQIDCISLPFNGDVKDACLRVLQCKQYTPQQRLQSVFNEIGKIINQNSEIIESDKEVINNMRNEKEISDNKLRVLAEFLNSLNKELKNLSLSERQINKNRDCKSDEQFLQFVAKKCAEVDPLISEYESLEPSFIPSYFLFSDDLNQRSKIIQKLFEPNDETFSLFTTQFLINIVLRRQLTQALGAAQVSEKASQALNELGIEKLSDFPSFVKEIEENVQKWKYQKKKLSSALKVAQSIIKQNQQSLAESQKENNRIKLENEKINAEAEALEMKLQRVQSELENAQKTAKQREYEIQESLMADEEINDKIKEAEELIQEKENEIRNLEEKYALLERRFKSEVDSYNRKIAKMEKNNTIIVEEFRKTNEEKDIMYNKQKAKHRRNVKEMRNNYERQIDELRQQYETAKSQFDSIVSEMKEKNVTLSNLYQKIICQLQESEQVNVDLRSENTALANRAKAAEAERKQSSESFAKNQRQIQAQIAAQSLAADSKAQERVMAVRAEAEAAKQRLFDIVSGSIGDLYGVGSEMLDENSLKMLLLQARRDIDKLKIFQNSSHMFE